MQVGHVERFNPAYLAVKDKEASFNVYRSNNCPSPNSIPVAIEVSKCDP